jgi:hypothetical protein
VAAVVGASAAAGGAAAGSEVLTTNTFKPGADLATVRGVLRGGPLWRSIHPENDGLGVDAGCGVPPSPALAAQCAAETAHALADPLAAAAVRIIVPRGAEPCAFADALYTHGALIGRNLDVGVHAVDVTKDLEAPLAAASSGRPPAYAVKHKLVILTFPNGRRAMQLLHLGEYHPGWLTGQLGMGAQMLHLPPADFVELYRLPLWAALAAIPRALLLGKGTPAATLAWELGAGTGFQKVVKGALNSRGGRIGGPIGGAATGALAAAAAAAAPSTAEKKGIRAMRAAAVAAAGGKLSAPASRAWFHARSPEERDAWLIAQREDGGALRPAPHAAPAHPRAASTPPPAPPLDSPASIH